MSIKEIVMPKLGESVTEGTITSWLVKNGDVIQKYDPIVEVMSDKVNAEVPSTFTGTITEIIAEEGDVIEVGELIAYIETEEKESVNKDQTVTKPLEEETLSESHITSSNKEDSKEETNMKTRYSPAVLHLAQEHDIDLKHINGTGLGGRITRKDVKQYINHLDNNVTVPKESKDTHTEQTYTENGDTIIPVSNVRKSIANQMVQSTTEIPHAWMTIEVDVTGMVKYRNKIKETFKQQEGYNLTYFTFFIYAVARALKEYPELNSTWEKDQIIQRNNIHISIAVAKENELFVPVIKNADEKSVQGIAKEITELARKARRDELTISDMQGGTFTVNNTGTFGSVSSMGIINYPQAAILQVESIVKRPVIIDDMFAARDMVNLSLSLDHRILDGLICGRFLARIKEILEEIDEDTKII